MGLGLRQEAWYKLVVQTKRPTIQGQKLLRASIKSVCPQISASYPNPLLELFFYRSRLYFPFHEACRIRNNVVTYVHRICFSSRFRNLKKCCFHMPPISFRTVGLESVDG